MKKYRKINKITENPFLNLFEIEAFTNKGKEFRYYFVSRNSKDNLKLFTKETKSEGMVIYPLLKEDPGKIVLIKQYRYPLDTYLYELPAGLIDQGETAEEAAIREMKEETGLVFEPYHGGNQAFRRPLFMGAGFTDEGSSTVFGFASGNVADQQLEETESIEVHITDKDEARRILAEERVSLRCGLLLMNFLKSDSEKPFDFLET